MKIVNYKKFILSLVIIIIFNIISISFAYSLIVDKPDTFSIYEEYTIQRGDTVWDIAKQYCTGNDIRDFVYFIAQENNLINFVIIPGETIIIPLDQQ